MLIDGLIWVFSLSGEISGCAIDLGEGYMVRNVNVNVDFVLGFPVNLLGD